MTRLARRPFVGVCARSVTQGYLASEGVKYLLQRGQNPPGEKSGDIEASTYRSGWIFILLNFFDELKVIAQRGGLDEHFHHTLCLLMPVFNMALLRRTSSMSLKTSMTDAFFVLLANELVTPLFNAYALLKRYNIKQQGAAPIAVLIALLPALLFRTQNSGRLLYNLSTNRKVGETSHGQVFRFLTGFLCVGLMVLDVTWVRWTLKQLSRRMSQLKA